MARKLIVEVVGDSRSYERSLQRSAAATNQFGQAMGAASPKVGKLNTVMGATGTSMIGLAGAAAGLAVVIGAKSIQAASDLNEQISRTEVIMGSASDATIKWSETTAESMGISQRAALSAASSFAGLFQTVGTSQADAAAFSRTLVQLAADLASLQNTSPEEALVALRSGLAGEAEPLRRFNIFLTEARVQQEALAETGKATTSALTQQEKTLARYNLILQDGAVASGNFELTSGGLANQQRILAAQVDDLSTKLGAVLVPAMIGVVGAMNDAVGAGESFLDVLGKLADIPGIEIPVKLVRDLPGGMSGEDLIRHIVLRGISPAAEGFVIGKEIVEGIQDGLAAGATGGDRFPAPATQPTVDRIARDKAAQQAATAQAGQAAVDRVTRAAAAGQASLNKQLADSETRAAHLRDLIRGDPNNVKLQQRLRAELDKQANLKKQIAAASKADAIAAKAAADAAKAAADAAARERRERERIAAQRRAEAAKAAQFAAIGLTPEGLKPTPGGGALLQRALSIEDQFKDAGRKVPAQLRKIIDFLKKHLRTAKQEVRAAILDMLNAWGDAFDGDGAKQGPLTSTHGLRSAQIIKNLGLTAEQADEIQRRLARATTPGTMNRATGGGRSTIPGQHGGPSEPFVVESYVTVNIDGKRVANVVTRNQQKDRRRNPRQKRGQHRN